MSMDPEISALIGDIYDAAMTPQGWPNVLDKLRDRFHASAVGLHSEDLGETGFALYHTDTRFDPDMLAIFKREYSLKPKTHAGMAFYPLFPLARPILRTAFQDDAGFTATDMYQQWMRPMGIFYIALTMLMTTATGFVFLQLARGRHGGDFTRAELELLALLAPHLRRAVQMQHRLALADSGRVTLDCLPWGILTVDGAGTVLTRNRTATAMLKEADGLTVGSGDRLVAGGSCGHRQALQGAIRQACRSAEGETPPPAALALPRPSGRRPLALLVAPVRNTGRPGEPPAVAVFIGDPERRRDPPADVLHRLYGLTPAEAALTLALLDGSGLPEAAERLGIGLATAKTQLQAVFGKTDTRRQAQLVGLVLKGPAAIAGTAAAEE